MVKRPTAHLEDVPLFAGCSRRQLQEVQRAIEVLDVDDDRIIARQGARAEELFVVVTGEIRLLRDGRGEAVVNAGQWTDPLAVLVRRARDHSLVAGAGTRVLVLGRRELTAVIDCVAGVGRRLLTTIAEAEPTVRPRLRLVQPAAGLSR